MIKTKRLLSYSVFSLMVTLAIIFYFLLYYELITKPSLFMIAFLLLVCYFIYIKWIKEQPIPRSILVLIVISFFIKSYYAYNTYSTIISPFPDSFGYINNLEILLATSNLNLLDFKYMESTIGTSQFFYYYLIYFVYIIFNDLFSLYLLNILLGSFSCIMLYLIVNKDFGKKIAFTTTVLATFSMNIMVFSSNILKDGLVLYLTILVFYLYKVSNKRHLLLIVFLIGCLTMTRIYAGFSVIAAIGVDMIFNRYLFKRRITRVFAFFSLLLIVFFAFNSSFLSRYITLGERFVSQYSTSDIISVLPTTLIALFFEPYPWGVFSGEHTIYSLMQIDSAIALIFSFALFMFLYKFIRFKDLRIKMYLYITPILVHAYALGLAYGGGLRQKIGAFSFIILIFVVGLFYKRKTAE